MTTEQRQQIEKRIVTSLVDELLSHGFKLSVEDEEDERIYKSGDREAILAVLFLSDEETIYAWTDTPSRTRIVQLVYGNDGYDVICDNSSSLEPFIVKTSALAEDLAELAVSQ